MLNTCILIYMRVNVDPGICLIMCVQCKFLCFLFWKYFSIMLQITPKDMLNVVPHHNKLSFSINLFCRLVIKVQLRRWSCVSLSWMKQRLEERRHQQCTSLQLKERFTLFSLPFFPAAAGSPFSRRLQYSKPTVHSLLSATRQTGEAPS